MHQPQVFRHTVKGIQYRVQARACAHAFTRDIERANMQRPYQGLLECIWGHLHQAHEEGQARDDEGENLELQQACID